MKQKLIPILTALTLTALLTACGGQPQTTPGPETGAPAASQEPSQGAPAADTFSFHSGEFSISIDQDMADILAALGEPQSYFEAASCAFEGLDKTYTYPGFSITTRPEGDKDYVNSILLTDDSITTPEGVYIGSTRADVTAAYGDSDGEAALSYTKGSATLTFILDGDTVLSIEYLPA